MFSPEDKKWIKATVVDELLDTLHELIIPRFEKVEGQLEVLVKDVGEVKGRLDTVEVSNDNILRTVERIENRLDIYGERIDNHEQRLVKLETIKTP